jgi:hypothetical protein
MYELWRTRQTRLANLRIGIVACLFCALGTAVSTHYMDGVFRYWLIDIGQHMIVNIIRLYNGFIHSEHARGGPASYFARISQRTFTTKVAIYSIQTLLGDGVMVSAQAV